MDHQSPDGKTTQPVVVVIPCFNEEGAIAAVVDEISDALSSLESWELVVVDDGSDDSTATILEELARTRPHLRVIRHAQNRGYGAALRTGIRRSTAPTIVITDADGTYPTDRILDLVHEAAEADMVVGARTGPEVTYPLLRRLPKFFLSRYASWITGVRIPDMNSGLRVMRRTSVEPFLSILPSGFSFTTTITIAMLTNGYDVQYVPIRYSARVGKSKIQPVRDTLRFLQLIMRTGMYFAPLRVFFPIAAVLGVAFLASLIYDIVELRNLTDKTLMLLLFCMNTGMFALLADMLDKRSDR